MIVIKISSGLGNQLFQYAIGKRLSTSKSTVLKFDLSFYGTQNLRSYKLNKYYINTQVATDDEISRLITITNKNKIIKKVLAKVERNLPKQFKKYYREDEWWIYEPKLLLTTSNVYIDGYWQHYKYFTNFDAAILKEISIKEGFTPQIQNIVNSIEGNENAVSIHIRRGDYVSDPQANKLFGLLPLEYYYAAINYIKQNMNDPVFYIFSDDLPWVRQNFRFENNMILVDGEKDYIDLEVMRRCKHNIIANSSFSWWAAFLNKNVDKIVIAPRQWVASNDINKKIEIQFPSWIKM